MIRACLLMAAVARLAAGQNFSLEQVTGFPYPNELTAAATGSRIAWAVNERGKRNLYVAEGPGFAPRKLTHYLEDDGQELTAVTVSRDGQSVVYVRGGDHGANWDPGLAVNPTFSVTPPKVQVWSIAFRGGEPKLIGEGDHPEVSADAATVAFIHGGQAFAGSMSGGTAKALFTTRGTVGELRWSPDGSALAFTANRGDHSFIGVYREGKPLTWLAPGFSRDRSPRWSPDGTRVAFVRTLQVAVPQRRSGRLRQLCAAPCQHRREGRICIGRRWGESCFCHTRMGGPICIRSMKTAAKRFF